MTKRTLEELDMKIKEWTAKNTPISRRQAKQALFNAGLLSDVQPTIDNISDSTEREIMQMFWDDAQTFERTHPALVDLATQLGLTGAELDDLFLEAKNL